MAKARKRKNEPLPAGETTTVEVAESPADRLRQARELVDDIASTMDALTAGRPVAKLSAEEQARFVELEGMRRRARVIVKNILAEHPELTDCWDSGLIPLQVWESRFGETPDDLPPASLTGASTEEPPPVTRESLLAEIRRELDAALAGKLSYLFGKRAAWIRLQALKFGVRLTPSPLENDDAWKRLGGCLNGTADFWSSSEQADAASWLHDAAEALQGDQGSDTPVEGVDDTEYTIARPPADWMRIFKYWDGGSLISDPTFRSRKKRIGFHPSSTRYQVRLNLVKLLAMYPGYTDEIGTEILAGKSPRVKAK